MNWCVAALMDDGTWVRLDGTGTAGMRSIDAAAYCRTVLRSMPGATQIKAWNLRTCEGVWIDGCTGARCSA